MVAGRGSVHPEVLGLAPRRQKSARALDTMVFSLHYIHMNAPKGKVLAVCSVGLWLIAILTVVKTADAAVLLIDEYGDRYSIVSYGQVLGEGSGKEEKRQDSSGNGSSGVREEKQRIELRSPSERVKIESETRKDGSIRIKQEIRTPNERTRIEVKDGRLEIRVKPPEADDVDQTDEATESAEPIDAVRVRERIDKDEVEIRADGSRVEIKQGKTRVRTDFPLAIGANNELIVTTPNGSRKITVLPDAAVSNLLRNGILTISEASPAAQSEQGINLVAEDDKLVYKVRGTKNVKFLGLVPVAAPVEANVSAESGTVSSVVLPFYLNFFGFLFR